MLLRLLIMRLLINFDFKTQGIRRQLAETKEKYKSEKEMWLQEVEDLKKETHELRSMMATKDAEHEQW